MNILLTILVIINALIHERQLSLDHEEEYELEGDLEFENGNNFCTHAYTGIAIREGMVNFNFAVGCCHFPSHCRVPNGSSQWPMVCDGNKHSPLFEVTIDKADHRLTDYLRTFVSEFLDRQENQKEDQALLACQYIEPFMNYVDLIKTDDAKGLYKKPLLGFMPQYHDASSKLVAGGFKDGMNDFCRCSTDDDVQMDKCVNHHSWSEEQRMILSFDVIVTYIEETCHADSTKPRHYCHDYVFTYYELAPKNPMPKTGGKLELHVQSFIRGGDGFRRRPERICVVYKRKYKDGKVAVESWNKGITPKTSDDLNSMFEISKEKVEANRKKQLHLS